ncbi:hypothetical protein Pmar_PMAR023845 [Perkinsus marinus ATCC 50983]|uniref:Uncharacterized protein n=1 Tax=Perkinsus marinus (strain ATCC 50983 / TXsc) TaxID=423536 RepID=C5LVX2_PERM5|nr:hypothetical protein Pmar_PMAR023845 [Perkinsus marinus ATCC 50983]EEQ99123.1 hypothetical protein Pmar_PMAR023845 [Perkinsus marinus ATCC 50983]|eukprot:XP_002766406.1 hypothetical protein Pmar_PMAR023845 [Perkinsus marinus ATCC 50983]
MVNNTNPIIIMLENDRHNFDDDCGDSQHAFIIPITSTPSEEKKYFSLQVGESKCTTEEIRSCALENVNHELYLYTKLDD